MSRVTVDVVNALFPNHMISRKRISNDFPFTDFFLWAYQKSKVYQDNRPRTGEALKKRIRQEVDQILLAMLRNVMKKFKTRLEKCLHLDGCHLNGVILKTSIS